MVHGAQIANAQKQLVTLPELTAGLPNAANAAYYLDWFQTRVVVLDIEKDCPPELTDQLIASFILPGLNGRPAPALYHEVSMSGRGYHIVLPAPTNINQYRIAASKPKIQHPQKWYEILFCHWITFTRVPIPTDRYTTIAPDTPRCNLEGVLAQLIELNPAANAPAPVIDKGPVTTTLSPRAAEILKALQQTRPYDIVEPDSYSNDLSKYEMAQMYRLATAACRMYRTRAVIDQRLGTATPSPEQTHTDITAITHALARQELPHREKHDRLRSGLPFLLVECSTAAAKAISDAH